MQSKEVRQKFLEFFEERGHKIVPSSSLLPDDPSVLLTTAGMQQFKKYYTGESDPMKDFGSKNTVSIQKSFRTSDIDEVGDESHLTFFEMLGNFSFGGYFKKEAIIYAYDFIAKELGLKISYVTIFRGSHGVPKDGESRKIWETLGVQDIREEGMEDVFWGPTGSSGPCGPTTEIYCKNADGEDIEIWNIVFNEFFYSGSREELLSGAPDKRLEKLKTPGVDTGMGLERLAMIAQNKKNIFETDLFRAFHPRLLGGLGHEREMRIVADHLRASVFLLSDGIRPSNKEAGYILRRLLRRIFVYEYQNKMPRHILDGISHDIIREYGEFYPELLKNSEVIQKEIRIECDKFLNSLEKGINMLENIKNIDGVAAFNLYETYGIPYEIIKKLGGETAKSLTREAFDEEFKKHQELSRAGAEKKFGGHGLVLNTGELKAADEEELQKVTRLHTATHLLQAALRKVVGEGVCQAGSDITSERLRFDFSFERKLTDEELKQVEDLVNFAAKEKYSVKMKEMPYEEALKSGALHFFKEKYPATVKVYSVGNFEADPPEIFSKELCGGPHVKNTSEIGRFKILKQEPLGSGLRRIRAMVE